MLNKFRKQGNGFIVNRDGVGTVACVYPDYFMVEPENQKKTTEKLFKGCTAQFWGQSMLDLMMRDNLVRKEDPLAWELCEKMAVHMPDPLDDDKFSAFGEKPLKKITPDMSFIILNKNDQVVTIISKDKHYDRYKMEISGIDHAKTIAIKINLTEAECSNFVVREVNDHQWNTFKSYVDKGTIKVLGT